MDYHSLHGIAWLTNLFVFVSKTALKGSGGAYEVSVRFTSLLGWGATTDFKEDWVYDQAVENYVENEENAAALRKANPQAFANILKRSVQHY